MTAVDPQVTLREQILNVGLDDWVSLAEVETIIERYHLADTAPERQKITLEAVRSLLDEGLAQVGVPPGRGEQQFCPWPGSVDEVMGQLTERFVGHYDDPDSWEYAIWIGLTTEGDRAAAAERGRPRRRRP